MAEVVCNLDVLKENYALIVDWFSKEALFVSLKIKNLSLSQGKNTILSDIFHKNFSTRKLYLCAMMRSTVLSVEETVLFLEFAITIWACPSNKLWLKID